MKVKPPAPEDIAPEIGVTAAFRQAMRGIASTVSVITTRHGDVPCGVTVTSVTSVAMSPPTLLVCLHRQGSLRDRLATTKTFCVNVLRENHQHVSQAFAGGLPQHERFSVANGGWGEEHGVPYLTDAHCAIFCSVEGTLDWGTHTIFLGGVRRVRLSERGAPLLYFDGQFARLDPPAERPR